MKNNVQSGMKTSFFYLSLIVILAALSASRNPGPIGIAYSPQSIEVMSASDGIDTSIKKNQAVKKASPKAPQVTKKVAGSEARTRRLLVLKEAMKSKGIDPEKFVNENLAMSLRLGVDHLAMLEIYRFESLFLMKKATKDNACGLIQFTNAGCSNLSKKKEFICEASAIDQLVYVEEYMRKAMRGKTPRRGMLDMYLAVFCPAGMNQDGSFILYSKERDPKSFARNKGMDFDGDKAITVNDVYHKLKQHCGTTLLSPALISY